MGSYWADLTGRRNTLDQLNFEESVECFGWCLPAECFARPCVQRVSHRIQLILPMLAEVGSLGEVLAGQTIGVLVAAALPGTLRVSEIDVEASVDPEWGVLCHLCALVPGQ